jgi:hypothetical protein
MNLIKIQDFVLHMAAYHVINKIEKRFSNELTEIFGIVPAALTANEANYLVGFRSADEIRNRIAKAQQIGKFPEECKNCIFAW